MSIFCSYAKYYDVLYAEKDYAGEVRFVCEQLEKHAPGAHSVLELGCGTGGHAEHLARRGLRVHGIDMSDEMLLLAKQRRASLPTELAEKITLGRGDARNLELAGKYDVVLALFHVMSYQCTDRDLLAVFSTARKHLKANGILMFDCWYGPGVMTQRPEVRVKRIQNGDYRVVRIAEPAMHPGENVVDVNYHMIVIKKRNNQVEEHRETHRMRYLFLPEIELLMSTEGFSLADFGSWMDGEKPGFSTWSVYCVAHKGNG